MDSSTDSESMEVWRPSIADDIDSHYQPVWAVKTRYGCEDATGKILRSKFFTKHDVNELRLMTQVPRTHCGRFQVDYMRLMRTQDVNYLKEFLQNNIRRIEWTDYLEDKLEDFIIQCARPGLKRLLVKENTMAMKIRVIGVLLDDYLLLSYMVDTFLFDSDGQAAIEALKERCRSRVLSATNEIESIIKELDMELDELKCKVQEKDELASELKAARNYILDLQQRKTVAEPYSQEEFVQELQYRLYTREFLNSSLQDELQLEREMKEDFLNKYLQSEAKRETDQYQQRFEILESVKYLEMQDIFLEAVYKKIESLSPNPSDIKPAVIQWLRTIHEAIESRSDDISQLTDELKRLNHQYSLLQRETDDYEIAEGEMQEWFDSLQEELLDKLLELKDVEEPIQILEEQLRMEEQTRPTSSKGFKKFLPGSKFWTRKRVERPESAPFSEGNFTRTTSPLPPLKRWEAIPGIDIIPPTPIVESSQSASDAGRQSSFNESVYLKSPRGQDPVLVKIGVDPKPLTDTENGEVFTCDVSLDVQRGPQGAIPKLSRASPRRITLPPKLSLNKSIFI